MARVKLSPFVFYEDVWSDMRERLFRFKQFSVSHSASAMKVGTDGVTIGAWATVGPGDTVLDVGAGCGLIGLMAAQRGASAVTLLEIDPPASAEAAANAAASPWAGITESVCGDFLTMDFGGRVFDRIISNPPFFTNGALAPEASRALARHESRLTLDILTARASTLLAPGGTLCIIIPADSADRALFAAKVAGLSCVRRASLFTRRDAPPRRVLLEFSAISGPCRCSDLIIGSDEYKNLTSSFYL